MGNEILITVISSIIVAVLLLFIIPPLKTFRKKLLYWIKQIFLRNKNPEIDPQRYEDLKLLEEIENPLLFINQLPSFPDTKKEDIRDRLNEIQMKARKIRTPDFNDIKTKLIQYGERVDQVHINIGLKDLLKLLVRENGAFTLVEEIREIVSDEIKKKD